MRTKKHIEVLLENGIHFNTIMNLSDRQVGILSEKFFKSKPMGDVEQAKKDSLKSMRAFIKRYLGVEDPDSLSDKTVLEKMKMVARHADSPSGANKITKLGADAYRIAKDLFEGNKKETNEVATYSTQTNVYDPRTEKGPLDAALNDPTKERQVTVTKDNKIAVTSGKVPNLEESGEVSERFASKAQQKLFFAKCGAGKTKEEKKWCRMRDEFAAATEKMDYKKMPEKLHPKKTVKYKKKKTNENYEKFLEDKIFEMIEKHIEPTMTKGDLLKSIQEKIDRSNSFMLENPKKNTMFAENEGMEMKKMKRPISNLHSIGEASKEKEAPVRPDTDKGRDRKKKNPFRDPNPGVKENPKAEDGKEKQKNDFMSIITSILRK
jgi:hypothetical protein